MKWSLPILRHYARICVSGLTKKLTTAGIRDGIQTRDLPNRYHEYYSLHELSL
jgi:hypothetical protein